MRSVLIPVLLLSTFALAQQNTPPAPEPQSSQQTQKAGEEKPRHEEHIVVTGTYAPLPLEEVDRNVQAIDIHQSPALYRNFDDVLKSDPSVDLRQRAPGIQGDLSLRGSTFGQTLVLVNGVRVNDVQTGHHNLDLPVSLNSIERVEVLHGSGSTLYGSDAVGGAVNFITAAPTRSELRFGASGGSFGTNAQDASLAFAARRFTEQASFARELSTGFLAGRDYRSLAFSSQSTVRSAPGLTDILLAASDRPFGAALFYGNYNSWERTRSWLASAQQALGANTSAMFAYRRHTDDFILLRANPSVYENKHLTESFEAALRRHDSLAKNVRVFYGTEGFHDSISSSNLGNHQRDRGAFYANLDVRALHRFSFAAGVRKELFTGGQRDFSPTVSGGYWLSSRVKFKGSVSHAFRLPTYTDLYYHSPTTLGNASLKPERAWSYEGGAQITLTPRVSTELTVFHRRVRDGIDYVMPAGGTIWQAANLTRVNFTGFEAAARIAATRRQRFDVAYSALSGAQEALEGLQSQYVFNYPVHAASVSWLGELPGGVASRARLQAIQRYQRDAYPLLDLSLTREFRSLHPYVQFTNLTNTGYAEIAGPPAVPMPGRAVIAGVEIVLTRKK